MIIATNYKLTTNKKGVLSIVNLQEPLCPVCQSKMYVRDSKKRRLINEDGSITILSLRRLKCPKCQKMHTEIPDFIEPNKHYTKAVIEKARYGMIDDLSADNRTISRWRKND